MKKNHGQAALEFLVAATFVLVPLLFIISYLGKTGDVKHRAYESARYAAWEAATTTKTPSEINYELSRRVISQDFSGIDSVHDRTATGTRDAAPAPLYFHTDTNGIYRPILQKLSGSFSQYTLANKTPDGDVYGARETFLNNPLVDFDLEQDGLINASVNYQLAQERNLPNIASLSPGANNALYAQNWRRVTFSSLENSLEGAVLGERAFDNSLFDQLAQLASAVGFEEWDDFEPGIIERDVVPCSRVVGGGNNREAACE
ncbi:hypothetical protein PVT68_11665 [Microbulbifer bruguierae]|uniref:Pilus assembly protein n=1 Tax=Microbulbifer bruguierae TaxID=3029061 RepID=A0ABY8NAC4_9GAMM|nr:hypothetical protein [Microbulbifer bruguierae]WGL15425.1 hypothetical protein PVT68_11665 [Microbulbifer bruguierae]